MSALDALWAALPGWLAAHVELTLLSLGIGLAISLPLGVLVTRRPRLEAAALGVASVLQTIPALALLALMVPLLGFLGTGLEGVGLPAPPSIGFLPAVLALSLYSVLPMLRNTVTGLAGVDPAMREAARGVGMSPAEALWQVELPLALPTIVAGIRTATVWVVGMATLATPVGGTSLGNPIFAGLQTRNLSAVLVGSLAAAVLAIVLDGLVRAIETGLGEARRWRAWVALALLALIGTWAVTHGADASAGGADPARVRIGSKSFTEQYLLAEILAGVLEEQGAVAVERVPSLGSTVAFDALAAGDLDLYVDYSGTIWATVLGEDAIGATREAVLGAVRARLPAEHGIIVLAALGFENTYALALRGADAERLGARRISDLRPHAPRLEILGDYEFFERPEWRAIRSGYGLRFARERAMDSSLMYEALVAGSGDVISAYSTDGRIAAYDLRTLTDDLGVIPPYDAIVLASAAFVARRPALAEAVRSLAGRIPASAMRRLNARVDLGGEAPGAVAMDWLETCLDRPPGRSPEPICGGTGDSAGAASGR